MKNVTVYYQKKFNPYNKYTFNKENYDFDRKLVFASAVFLLFTTGISQYLYYISNYFFKFI